MITHKSTAYIPAIAQRIAKRGPIEPITKQVRMVIRLAVACAANGTPYDMAWRIEGTRAVATITATGVIPMPKPLAKPAPIKTAREWTPKQWDAEYRLNAHHSTGAIRPAFVIDHESGLCLTMPTGTGEWGSEHGDADPNGKWHVTHKASGKGFGLELPIQKAADALTFAAAQGIDWTLSADDLGLLPAFRRAGLLTVATFGSKAQRIESSERMERLAA